MRKRKRLLVAAGILGLTLLSGCSGNAGKAGEECVGTAITQLKTGDTGEFEPLLDQGIEAISDEELYVLEFPEELRADYLDFLQEAFSCIKFEVSPAEEKDNGSYSVQVAFEPLDLAGTLQETSDAYLESMTGSDLGEEVSSLLSQSVDVLQTSPVFGEKTKVEIALEKEGDAFSVPEEEIQKLIEESMTDYMMPFKGICDVLDIKDFVQAFLDAAYKGELDRYMEHTGSTEEEAQAWYEADGAFAPPVELPSEYGERWTAALKKILENCRYTVGIPRKEEGAFNYTVDVTVVPNRSLIDAMAELESGTYYDVASAGAAFVETLERYAENPTYGEETTVTISVNLETMLSTDESSDFYILGETICPASE